MPHPRNDYTPQRLAVTRQLLGLSNTELARLCQVNDRRVRSWLAGESQPSSAAAERLDRALEDLATLADDRMKTALRSRSRPVRLESSPDGSDLAVVSLVAGMLSVRRTPFCIQEAKPSATEAAAE